jgi:hypothetical protein
MKVTRVYSGADDESHFEEIEVDIGKLQRGDGIVFGTRCPGTSTIGMWRPGAST